MIITKEAPMKVTSTIKTQQALAVAFMADRLNKGYFKETRRYENEKGRFTLIFLAAENSDERTGLLELTY